VTEPAQQGLHGSAAEVTIDLVVFDELRACGESARSDFLAELIHQFARDTEPLLVQLREAFEIGDAAAVGRIAHSVKGSAGQLGGRRLALACDRLEQRSVAGRLLGSETDLETIESGYRELRRALKEELSLGDGKRPQGFAPEITERQRSSERILLAEDHTISQRVAAAMLENLGFRVDVVADGAQAVEAATGTRYAAILMDCQIPVADGYRATREIRRLEGVSRRTPIIAVTASATPSDRQRCLAAGMDDYLTKPLCLRTLRTVLARWAPDGSDRADIEQTQALLGERVGLAPVGDRARAVLDPQVIGRLQQLGNAAGEDFVRELAVLFVPDADDRIITLRTALIGEDSVAVARTAHALSGASAILGATELARLCAALASDGAAGDVVGGKALLEALETEFERVRLALEAMTAAPDLSGCG
jgi:CheY-like chemotaxis protein